jgi:SAM-dependent methyltransferase
MHANITNKNNVTDFYFTSLTNEGILKKTGMSGSEKNMRFRLNTLFKGFDFEGKRVLDIGGGFGLLSFYAAAKGARKVVCIEPELAGSSSDAAAKFYRIQSATKLDDVFLVQDTFQEYDPGDEKFDIVIIHNSINHLDEPACIALQDNDAARQSYSTIIQKLFSFSNEGARLLICDCSRYNFFSMLGLRNPFVPSIEWHKHQSPELWAKIFLQAGFSNPTIRWSSFSILGKAGKLLLGNKFIAFFLQSHFCLTLEKPIR